MSGHNYPGVNAAHAGREFFTSDCTYGCGCWMGGSRSGGPSGIDPFGYCPKAPTDTSTPAEGEESCAAEPLLAALESIAAMAKSRKTAIRMPDGTMLGNFARAAIAAAKRK